MSSWIQSAVFRATILTVALSGCGPVQTDFTHPLVGDYELVRTSAHEVFIVPKDGWTDEDPQVPSKVVEVATDRQFILAKRQQLKRRNESPRDDYELPVEGEFDYWIIDTKRPVAYGSLTEEEFRNKRDELGISPQIEMEDAGSFSPYRQNNARP